jgi:hypothetical protein
VGNESVIGSRIEIGCVAAVMDTEWTFGGHGKGTDFELSSKRGYFVDGSHRGQCLEGVVVARSEGGGDAVSRSYTEA